MIPLIQEIKSSLGGNEANAYSLIRGKVLPLVTHPEGYKAMSDYITSCGSLTVSRILKELRSQMKDLIVHPYGNYFIQKLFSQLAEKERLEILVEVSPMT